MRRAAHITETGPPESIRIGELPVPRVGPTDVLVAPEALVVDPVDTFIRSGAYRTPMSFPFVLGRDLVGEVVSIGPDVVGFRTGDRVWCNSMGHGGRQGTFATLVVVSSDRLYPLPPGADAAEAVAALHPAATAALGLRRIGLSAGETVYVGGAGGNVGACVTRLARAAGARVVATASPADHERCRELGVSAVFDYRDPGLARLIGEAAPEGVDVHWDTSGHHDLDIAVGVLARGGRIVAMAGLGARPELPVGALYTKDATLTGFAISNASIGELAAAAAVVNRELAGGGLPVPIAAEFALAETAEAHRETERAPSGRIVVRP